MSMPVDAPVNLAAALTSSDSPTTDPSMVCHIGMLLVVKSAHGFSQVLVCLRSFPTVSGRSAGEPERSQVVPAVFVHKHKFRRSALFVS